MGRLHVCGLGLVLLLGDHPHLDVERSSAESSASVTVRSACGEASQMLDALQKGPM
jgi:hypothetical protein